MRVIGYGSDEIPTQVNRTKENNNIYIHIHTIEQRNKKRPLSMMQIAFVRTKNIARGTGVSMNGYIEIVTLLNKCCIVIFYV